MARDWSDAGLRAGMSERQAGSMARLFARAEEALDGLDGRSRPAGRFALFVPGRIEVLGKHTDYAGGRSLLCAVEQGFAVVASPRSDCVVRIVDAAWNDRAEFSIDRDLVPRVGHWSNYPMTVGRRIARNFPGASTGADVALCSDLPPDAGMSSSSALLVASFLVLAEPNRLAGRAEYRQAIGTPDDLAGFLGTVENGESFGLLAGDRGVGTFGGSEDHTAILCCRPGTLSQYAFCPVRHERTVELPPGWTFVVASSGVAAPKTGAARERYNRASRATRRILEIWRSASRRQDLSLAAAVADAPGGAAEVRDAISRAGDTEFGPDLLVARFDQFVAESLRIVPAMGDALGRGDFAAVGSLVDQSQRWAETGLGNQIPETIGLARIARELGAAAASAFGAGFGGSVWALVRDGQEEAFSARWAAAYGHAFPAAAGRAVFLATRPGPPASRVA